MLIFIGKEDNPAEKNDQNSEFLTKNYILKKMKKFGEKRKKTMMKKQTQQLPKPETISRDKTQMEFFF